MKFKLMIQSLSPLALLTIIKNFSFTLYDETGVKLLPSDFISENLSLLCVMGFCVIWLLLSIWFLLDFCVFKYVDREQGYTIVDVVEKEDASLNFFLTLILPLLIDDVNTYQGLILFVVMVVLIAILLSKTNLFYANPILALLGYRVYTIRFVENPQKAKERYTVVCRGKLSDLKTIEYKDITDDVLYMKEMEQK